ncbi:MAG: hypothetical protein KAY37_06045 [Phycisphaerae bacterium]|nr:hypothetical protein [Phycisphaerae bacterium]
MIEMLVSLAVLTLALSVVGVVFTVTTKTSSQASAYSQTHTWVRQFMTQIEEDLQYCEPSKSILVLEGRTQAAALTAEDLEAGKYHRVLIGDPQLVPGVFDPEFTVMDPLNPNTQYSNPRADLLMFFTNRPTVSQAPPPEPAPLPNDPQGNAALHGAKFTPIQVVYGHAALGEAVLSGSYVFPNDNALRHIMQTKPGSDLSIIPANRWHLSRRQAIISQVTTGLTSDMTFTNLSLERIVLCEPGTENESMSGGMRLRKMPGDMAFLNLKLMLEQFDPFTHDPAAANLSPYYRDSAWGPQWPNDLRNIIDALLYSPGGASNRHVATVLEEVPVELRNNLGVQLLPGCVWFQVEFLMPEDPRNSFEYASPFPADFNYSRPSDMPRWTAVEPNRRYVFVPDTLENRELIALQVHPNLGTPTDRLATFARLDQTFNNDVLGIDVLENRIIRMWPYAIRVTVRAYDGRGRLNQPIIRSIVHRFE